MTSEILFQTTIIILPEWVMERGVEIYNVISKTISIKQKNRIFQKKLLNFPFNS